MEIKKIVPDQTFKGGRWAFKRPLGYGYVHLWPYGGQVYYLFPFNYLIRLMRWLKFNTYIGKYVKKKTPIEQKKVKQAGN